MIVSNGSISTPLDLTKDDNNLREELGDDKVLVVYHYDRCNKKLHNDSMYYHEKLLGFSVFSNNSKLMMKTIIGLYIACLGVPLLTYVVGICGFLILIAVASPMFMISLSLYLLLATHIFARREYMRYQIYSYVVGKDKVDIKYK